MAKDTIHFGLSVVTNPYIKGQEIISLALVTGEDTFVGNIQPTLPFPSELSRYWTKHPREWEVVTEHPAPREQVVGELVEWMGRYKGTHIAIGGALDFYTLFGLLIEETGKCSFGSHGFVDYTSYQYGMGGRRLDQTKLPVLPLERAKLFAQVLGQVEGKGKLPKGEWKRQLLFDTPMRAPEPFDAEILATNIPNILGPQLGIRR